MLAMTRRLTRFTGDRLHELPEMSSIAREEMQLADARAVLANSNEVYAVENDGRIEAIVGLCGQMLGSSVTMWLACTEFAGIGFARFMHGELRRKLTEFDEVLAESRPDCWRSERFLYWLGFRCIGQNSIGLVWRITR
jgi:hypothetical protein